MIRSKLRPLSPPLPAKWIIPLSKPGPWLSQHPNPGHQPHAWTTSTSIFTKLRSYATSSSSSSASAPATAMSASKRSAPTADELYDDLPEVTDASSQYQKLSQLEHVLKRPDTYIGSVEFHESTMWVCDADGKMHYKPVSIVPGMFKIFDEILVNAADNKVRDPAMKTIKVAVNPELNEISVLNDGRGIPIEIHTKEKIYIPELIFGNLLTSSNYDDNQQKITGGRNGFGAKLCNIFSTKFVLETADKKQVYRQVWTDNMTKVEKPVISKNTTGKSYTSITFYPDLAKFSMEKLDEDLVSVLRRRVWDLAGTTRGVNVSMDGNLIPVKDFKAYVDSFVKALSPSTGDDDKPGQPVLYVKPNDRWELAFALSDGQFNQMSFVNSIATTSGGTHVNYIVDQIVNYVTDTMTKKNSKAGGRGGKLQKIQIKSNLFVFINCKINNPAFTSQTKEQLTSKVSSFGSKCEVPDKFLKDVLNKTELFDRLMALSEKNADKELSKNDGGKKRRLTGFAKLDDANKAGTRESHKCTLILTEGDSAHGLALSGLSVVGRDFYGCFPLRGKMLNVRDASQDQILKNAEISALKQIIGLQHKKHYTSVDGLRYGHLMIMTDQDYDGSHIKGLIINFLEYSFPGLLDIPGFLVEFITPVVKVTINRRSGKEVKSFFTMPEYEEWRDNEGKTVKWTQKYYKGLGTSTHSEFREYFSSLQIHKKGFHHLQSGDKERIELAFSKGRADDRKQWLQDYQPGTFLDPELDMIPISDFIDKELILFSMADNLRSIPSVMDGFKPGQRKVIWATFLRKLKKELKVFQLSGWVGEQAAYHHGDASLHQTIISLAQDFVGANNFYYLLPLGSFGSRAHGGKDAAAARYISTILNPLSKVIINPLDDPILKYMQEDDDTVEPEHYLPILPMLLVNGSEGIGTGWSSNIPSFNPVDIVHNLRRMMAGQALKPMTPWYRGWSGQIEKIPGSDHQFRVVGRIEEIDENTLAITELPVKMWTQTMKEFLLKSIIGGSKDKDKKAGSEFIQDFTEEHSHGVRFIVKISDTEMEKARQVGLYQKFKLIAPLSTSNMVAFDPQGRLHRYNTAEDILKEFYFVRLGFYQKRKDHMSSQLRNELDRITAQARFIKLIVDKELTVSNKPKAKLVAELRELRFPRFGASGVPIWEDGDAMEIEESEEASENEDDENDGDITRELEDVMGQGAQEQVKPNTGNYDYLLNMSILSLTRERYERLLKQRDGTEQELNDLLALSPTDLWNTDLDNFLDGWDTFLEKDREQRESLIPDKKTKAKGGRKRKNDSDDDDDFGGAPKKRSRTKTAAAVAASKPGVLILPPPIEEAQATKTRVKKEPGSKQATPAAEVSNGTSTVAGTPSETPAAASSAQTPATSESTPDPEPKAKAAAPKKAAATKKAPAKAAPKKIKKEISDDEDDEDDFDVGESVPAQPRAARPRRAAAPATMTISDGEESEQEADNSMWALSDED